MHSWSYKLVSIVSALACSVESGAGTDAATGGSAGRAWGGSGSGGLTPATAGAPGTAGGSGGVSGGGASGAAGAGSASASAHFSVKPATWKGGAKGAYSIIHDDLCGGTESSLENGTVSGLLAARGLRAGFGAIAGSCSGQNLWTIVQSVAASGQEILSHSWDHTDHACAPNLATQVDQAHTALSENVGAPTFYIFPFDSFNDSALAHLKTLGYLGARAGVKGQLNPADYADDFRLNFDVYGPGYSFYCDQGACSAEALTCRKGYTEIACTPGGPDGTNQGSDECKASILKDYVDAAMAQGGWGIREFHGVGDGWEPVPAGIYTAHLDYLKEKVSAGELWVETPTAVIKYRRSRQYCTATAKDWTLSFGVPSAECQKYGVPVTYEVTLSGPSDPVSLSALQKGSALSAVKIAERVFMIEVNPTLGDVSLAAL